MCYDKVECTFTDYNDDFCDDEVKANTIKGNDDISSELLVRDLNFLTSPQAIKEMSECGYNVLLFNLNFERSTNSKNRK